MVKDTFSIIPTVVLENADLSPADKLIFSVLFGFRLTQKCWASNNYISEKTKISIPTVNRSLKTLEKYGFISRVTTQEGMIKKREIVIAEIEEVGIKLVEVQNDPPHDQNDQTDDQNDRGSNQNDHLPMIKMISTPDQNDQSIDNIINNIIDNVIEEEPKHAVKLSDGEESKFVFLKTSEKKKLIERFKKQFGNDFYRDYLMFAVEALDSYIANEKKGKKYKDHYKVLINWPMEKAIAKFNLDQQQRGHNERRLKNL